MLCYAVPCCAVLWNAALFSAVLSCLALCCAMLCHAAHFSAMLRPVLQMTFCVSLRGGAWARRLGCRSSSGQRRPGPRPLGTSLCITDETFRAMRRGLGLLPSSSGIVRVDVVQESPLFSRLSQLSALSPQTLLYLVLLMYMFPDIYGTVRLIVFLICVQNKRPPWKENKKRSQSRTVQESPRRQPASHSASQSATQPAAPASQSDQDPEQPGPDPGPKVDPKCVRCRAPFGCSRLHVSQKQADSGK